MTTDATNTFPNVTHHIESGRLAALGAFLVSEKCRSGKKLCKDDGGGWCSGLHVLPAVHDSTEQALLWSRWGIGKGDAEVLPDMVRQTIRTQCTWTRRLRFQGPITRRVKHVFDRVLLAKRCYSSYILAVSFCYTFLMTLVFRLININLDIFEINNDDFKFIIILFITESPALSC